MCASTAMIVLIFIVLPLGANALGVVGLVMLARAIERSRRERFLRAGLDPTQPWPRAGG